MCSDSIIEVTARGEAYLAVKNNRFEAFKILADHVILLKKEEIRNKKDELGNSVLHVATYRKQYEVIHLVLDENYALNGTMEVNALNKKCLTPLDVLTSEGGDSEIEEVLRLAGSVRVDDLNSFPHQHNSQNLIATLSLSPGQEHRRDHPRLTSTRLQDVIKYDKIKDSLDIRNTLIVIAALITTATYQAVLSPSGGVWQDDSWPSTTNGTSSTTKHTAGTSVIWTHDSIFYGLFLLHNSLGFYMSVHMLYFLTCGLPMQFELRVALTALTVTYITCIIAIIPGFSIIAVLFVVMMSVMPLVMMILTKVVRDLKILRFRSELPSTVASA